MMSGASTSTFPGTGVSTRRPGTERGTHKEVVQLTPYDLAIVGGGINGAAIARLAARNGLRVCVLERGDLASGTSSASSHMLHGGLRYLEHGRFALVRESLHERHAVARMAPALVHPQRFLVPLHRGDRIGPLRLKAGLALYDGIAGRHTLARHAVVRPIEALELEPDLQPEGLRGAGLYSDAVMDDARLTIAVARDAAAHGAEILTYHEVVGARPGEAKTIELLALDRLEGRERAFAARLIVNATGPWTDATRIRLARALTPGVPDPRPLLRPSRGIHLVYPRLTRSHALLLTARSDGRVFFVVPFAGHALVGTTEVEIPSPPPAVDERPTLDEVRYLRSELAQALPDTASVPPIAILSGLRPLLAGGGDVGHASREHRVVEEGALLTVAGGKYTTFRVVARHVVARAAERLGRAGRTVVDAEAPLPAPLPSDASLERTAGFAVEHEFARRVEDVVRRRTALWLEHDRGRVAASRVAAVMARKLGWSAERQTEEFQSYDHALWEEEELLRRSGETLEVR